MTEERKYRPITHDSIPHRCPEDCPPDSAYERTGSTATHAATGLRALAVPHDPHPGEERTRRDRRFARAPI